MKFFENTCSFDYPWPEVSIANWRKYCAWNNRCEHVLAVDTISRSVSPTGELITERLITTSQNPPAFIASIFKSLNLPTTSHIYERSIVSIPRPPTTSALTTPTSPPSTLETDAPSIPSVVMTSRNLTLTQLMVVSERVSYTPHPADPQKTEFKQHAEIEATLQAWDMVKRKVEAFGVEAFGGNAEKGREGFGRVLEMGRKAIEEGWENVTGSLEGVVGGLDEGEVARRI
ncbi:MSF1-domain-containing protein [Ascobolus immersus RN42]|uniref:MSF1-domain-containing protein n=1 Tax=Ascobolus immersus RN42 TaxID=1160509 RepID=A0A3N4I3M9_ASCIM|nr:MSF1-domain-containing protein [Ascobolus immersus RN42]